MHVDGFAVCMAGRLVVGFALGGWFLVICGLRGLLGLFSVWSALAFVVVRGF